MIYRSHNISGTSTQGNLQPQVGLFVTAYRPGGFASADSSANIITLYPGHGFETGDKIMRATDVSSFSGIRTIQAITDTSIIFDPAFSIDVVAGDTIINLGADTGVSLPNYDGSDVAIFSSPSQADVISMSTVITGSAGDYAYWHFGGTSIWELIRSSNFAVGPVSFVVDAYQDAVERGSYGVNVKDYGAMGDGVTDDTAAFQAAVAALPSVPGLYSGGKILVPRGVYRISSQIDLSHGHFIEGEGPSGSCISVMPGFSGSALFKWSLTLGNSQGPGYGIRDIAIDGNGVNAHAIWMIRAYDGILIDNVKVDDTGPLANCFRIEGSDGGSSNTVSQSILLSNTYGIHARDSLPTAATYYFESCQEMTLNNVKGFGTYNNNLGSGDVFYFNGCRGVTVVGGAAANTTGIGYHVYTTDRTQEGFQFIGPTLEILGESIKCESSAGLATRAVYIYGPRLQIGTSTPATGTGPIVLNSTVRAWVTAATFEVQIGANSQDCYIHTDNLALVTSNLGSRTRVQADYDLADTTSTFMHAFGQGINLRDSSSGGPRLRFSHRDITPLAHWDLFWSRSSSADFGFQLRHFDGTATNKNVLLVDPDAGDLHLCSHGTEMLEIEETGIHSKGAIRGIADSITITGNDAITTLGKFLINITINTGGGTVNPTLVAPSSQDGQILILRISTVTSGAITLVDGGSVNIDGDWTTPGVADTIMLVASASTWHQVCRSNN